MHLSSAIAFLDKLGCQCSVNGRALTSEVNGKRIFMDLDCAASEVETIKIGPRYVFSLKQLKKEMEK